MLALTRRARERFVFAARGPARLAPRGAPGGGSSCPVNPRPIRVCQLTPCLWSGGTEERIARVMSGMDRREFSLSWMGFGPVREALVERAGPDVEVFPIERNVAGGVEPSLIARLARTLRRIRPDIMHVHNWSTSLYGIAAARVAGIPTVLYGLGGQDSTEAPSARRQAMMRALTPHVDRFTSVCGYLEDQLADYWAAPRERISVLKTGIDLAAVDEAPSQAEVRARLGLPADAAVVGAISVFRPVKRIPDLIDAVGAIGARHPNVHLLLVGNPLGVSPEELRSRADSVGLEGRFHLLGRVEKPVRTLPAFDVFVNCSAFEGTSNAILEAMASRIPIVATAVGGTPELVEDGVHGLLVPPAEVPDLAAALDRMLSDPGLREACGARGRAKVEAEHTYETMMRAYQDLYRQVARPRRRWTEQVPRSAATVSASALELGRAWRHIRGGPR